MTPHVFPIHEQRTDGVVLTRTVFYDDLNAFVSVRELAVQSSADVAQHAPVLMLGAFRHAPGRIIACRIDASHRAHPIPIAEARAEDPDLFLGAGDTLASTLAHVWGGEWKGLERLPLELLEEQ